MKKKYIFYMIGWFLAGLLFGRLMMPIQRILITARLSECEAKGGRYTYSWNKYDNRYYEKCSIQEKEINL